MDRFIAGFPAVADGDLWLSHEHGVAWQADREHIVAYDDAYYSKCASYEGQAIAEKINAGRIAFVARHFGGGRVVDVGIGSGEFIRKRGNTWGHDVNPVGIEWLKRNDLWAERLSHFGAATFWDVLEHVEEPERYLRQIQLHAWLFCSIPVFNSLDDIRASKHYRPGEHLFYFTAVGFIDWMTLHGFMLVEGDDFETKAGRESIESFAFCRKKWPH